MRRRAAATARNLGFDVAMMLDPQRVLVAAAGRSAARQLLEITACPYDPNGDPVEREQARIWVGAYLSARPPTLDSVDYTIGGGE